MKFSIQKHEFMKGLRFAQNVADRKSTMPMIANVMITVFTSGRITLRATDLNLHLACNVEGKSHQSGDICVDAKALHDAVKSMSGDSLTVTYSGGDLIVSDGAGSATLEAKPARDFPTVFEPMPLEKLTPVSACDFLAVIDQVAYAICKDETRFHLNGALIEGLPNGVCMVATDGHRLALCEKTMAFPVTGSVSLIVPRKFITELKRLLKNAPTYCSVGFDEEKKRMTVVQDGITLVGKLIDAQFPPYRAVIPSEPQHTVRIEIKPLVAALKAAKVAIGKNHADWGVKLIFDRGVLKLETQTSKASIPIENYRSDVPATTGVRPSYLLEALETCDGITVELSFSGETDPFRINHAGTTCVAMPMRV